MKGWLFKNIANFITVFGLIATILFLIVGINHPDKLWLVLILGILISLSDFFDGKIARLLDIRSPFGTAVDRLRDKIFVCSALILLFWQYWPNNENFIITILTELLVVLVILLEFLINSTWLYGLIKGKDVTAGMNGKIKVTCEFFAIAIWLASLTIDKYCIVDTLSFLIYPIDILLLISFYFELKSFSYYYQKYNSKSNKQ